LTDANGETFPFTLGHIASGAMLAGIVDRSTSILVTHALKQREEGIKKPNLALNSEHVLAAAGEVLAANRLVDHSDDIRALAELKRTKFVAASPAA